jgi:hypothetical protein
MVEIMNGDPMDIVPDDEAHTEFLLSALRVGSLRCKLMDNEINSIGIALKHKMIGPDTAVKWAHDMGLMFLIEPLPGTIGTVALANVDNGK